eukprot:s5591_g2.t1
MVRQHADHSVKQSERRPVNAQEEMPDMSILKRQPCSELWDRFQEEAREAGRQPQKLWMLYACATRTRLGKPNTQALFPVSCLCVLDTADVYRPEILA